MRKISLTEKLILFFMLLGTGAIGIIGMFSYYSARNALMDRTFNQLTSVRTVRKKQIEAFFADRIRDVELIANSQDAKQMLMLTMANSLVEKNNSHFFQNNFDRYLLQYLSECGYYKRLQVTGTYVKGIEMNIPVTDSLFPFSMCNPENPAMKRLSINLHKHTGGILVDYTESGSNGLYAAALISGTNGIVVLEISPEAINKIMLESNPEDGLGTSGESYLIGNDRFFRSESRFTENSVLRLQTRSLASIKVITGETSTTECDDYRGIRVLSSFTQLEVPGLQWNILAEIDYREAMVPVNSLRITIMIFTLLTGTVFFILTFLFARRITRPLIKLRKAVTSVGSGNLDTRVEIVDNDEIGELAESFNFMTGKLKQQNEQLLEERAGRLSSVIDGQEIERQRLSREMHDSVGQALSAIRLRLELATRADELKIKTVVSQAKELVDKTIDEVRAICRSLTPPALKEFGPVTAIRRLAEDAAQYSGLKLTFNVTGTLTNPAVKSGTYLYRIAQEAVNNVVKHAEAESIDIDIQISEHHIEFTCRDDGKGFDSSSVTGGNGILNMKERALLIGGFFILNTEPGKGTVIIVKIPYA